MTQNRHYRLAVVNMVRGTCRNERSGSMYCEEFKEKVRVTLRLGVYRDGYCE